MKGCNLKLRKKIAEEKAKDESYKDLDVTKLEKLRLPDLNKYLTPSRSNECSGHL